MSDPFLRIPEPVLPEHQLLRNAAHIPQLSIGLRDRVVTDVRRQIRNGRWADRLRIAGAVLAASLLVFFTWSFRWTNDEPVADQNTDLNEKPHQEVMPTMQREAARSYSTSENPSEVPVDPQGPQGGSSSRPEMKEMQQLNRLIEDIQGRNNTLCGLLPIW